ncbi:MAG: hypothetical protein LBK44_05285, partial [Spirochaetales bacterium]|nr:hypothetical protein [Spirochaetales bacterium]
MRPKDDCSRASGTRDAEWKKSKRGLALFVCALLVFVSCSKEKEKIAERLLEFESPSYTASADNSRIAELERDVAKYKAIVEEKVNAADSLGSYYKLLALAYLDKA